MKSLAKRNAEVAARTAARKAVVARNRAKMEEAPPIEARRAGGRACQAIYRTCACGRTIRGNSFFVHQRKCIAPAQSGIETKS